jgi:hypothetical protein
VLDEAIGLAGLMKDPAAAADKLGELSESEWTEHRSTLARGLRADDFDVISSAYVNLYEINAAATRLRDLAAAERVKKDQQTDEPLVTAARTMAAAVRPLVPELAAILTVVSAAPGVWKTYRDWLGKAIATSSLEHARERTQAALDVAKSAAQDSKLGRVIQGRRQRRRPNDPQSQGLSGGTSLSDQSVDEALSGEQTQAATPRDPRGTESRIAVNRRRSGSRGGLSIAPSDTTTAGSERRLLLRRRIPHHPTPQPAPPPCRPLRAARRRLPRAAPEHRAPCRPGDRPCRRRAVAQA